MVSYVKGIQKQTRTKSNKQKLSDVVLWLKYIFQFLKGSTFYTFDTNLRETKAPSCLQQTLLIEKQVKQTAHTTDQCYYILMLLRFHTVMKYYCDY